MQVEGRALWKHSNSVERILLNCHHSTATQPPMTCFYAWWSSVQTVQVKTCMAYEICLILYWISMQKINFSAHIPKYNSCLIALLMSLTPFSQFMQYTRVVLPLGFSAEDVLLQTMLSQSSWWDNCKVYWFNIPGISLTFFSWNQAVAE